MNRGDIPGFYFDEQKQKYFKIQANHLVPQGAKYSKGHVQQEKRKSKKRKLETREEARRFQQTVKRSPVLNHPIIGDAGLVREHGAYVDVESAALSQWRPQRVEVTFPDMTTCPDIHLSCAKYIPQTNQMVTASIHGHTGVSALHVSSIHWGKPEFEIPRGRGIVALHSGIRSIATLSQDDSIARVLACTDGGNRSSEVYLGTIPNHDLGISLAGYHLAMPSMFATAAVHQKSGLAGVLMATGITVLDAEAEQISTIQWDEDEKEYGPRLDWLNSNTIAYAFNTPTDQKNCVALWDIRTRTGISTRFNLRRRITGLLNPSSANLATGSEGFQLLIPTNHAINVFDTRMPHSESKFDAPLLSFPHVHQGPELDFTADGRNLIAAVDRDNMVQVYSLRSGRRVQALPMTTNPGLVKGLQWYEDEKTGSTLQACSGNAIVRWIWRGTESEEP